MKSILIAGAHKSSGKTTFAIGLVGALNAQGCNVQSFKKGPDYIDPMWLSLASGKPCYNLDFYTMDRKTISDFFVSKVGTTEKVVVEGNKGLFDGLDLFGSDSNAALAHLLDMPIVLVIDTTGMTRGIAPLLKGYTDFDPKLKIAGVVLNKVGGVRHENKLRRSIEHYTDISVVGALGANPEIEIKERHLGLIPCNELSVAQKKLDKIIQVISSGVNLEMLFKTEDVPFLPSEIISKSVPKDIRIAIARDAAFGFYYPDDLEALELAGAELIPFSTIKDKKLPDVDGLFIGGGFPEMCGAELSSNKELRTQINKKLNQGLPAYAECGGLMYLCRSISWRNQSFEMAGFLPAEAIMNDKPIGRGYVRLRTTGYLPWPSVSEGTEVNAHEFHYASLKGLPDSLNYAYEVLRGHGVDGRRDGLILKNLVANFSHQRNIEKNCWAHNFVDFVRSAKC